MPITFSGRELLEIAIQIEKNGFTFYSKAAQMVSGSKAKELMEWLAQEEKKHIGRFQEILSRFSYEDTEMSPSELEEYTLYLKALADARVFPTELKAEEEALSVKTARDAINMAIEFEKDSLLFLHGMRPLMKKGDAVAIDALAKEEMLHLKRLVELKR